MLLRAVNIVGRILSGLVLGSYLIVLFVGAYRYTYVMVGILSLLALLAVCIILIGGLQLRLEAINKRSGDTASKRPVHPGIIIFLGTNLIFLTGLLLLNVFSIRILAFIIVMFVYAACLALVGVVIAIARSRPSALR